MWLAKHSIFLREAKHTTTKKTTYSQNTQVVQRGKLCVEGIVAIMKAALPR